MRVGFVRSFVRHSKSKILLHRNALRYEIITIVVVVVVVVVVVIVFVALAISDDDDQNAEFRMLALYWHSVCRLPITILCAHIGFARNGPLGCADDDDIIKFVAKNLNYECDTRSYRLLNSIQVKWAAPLCPVMAAGIEMSQIWFLGSKHGHGLRARQAASSRFIYAWGDRNGCFSITQITCELFVVQSIGSVQLWHMHNAFSGRTSTGSMVAEADGGHRHHRCRLTHDSNSTESNYYYIIMCIRVCPKCNRCPHRIHSYNPFALSHRTLMKICTLYSAWHVFGLCGID